MATPRNIRLASYGMFGIWILSNLGLLDLALQLMSPGPPPLILQAVKHVWGTEDAVPLAYAWSLRIGVLLAMIWGASLVLGIALKLFAHRMEKRLSSGNSKASLDHYN